MSSTRAALRRVGTTIEPPWTPFERCTYRPEPGQPGLSLLAPEVYRNSRYQVGVRECEDGITHLSIHRLDRAACRDWRDFQRIKNELCDPERGAIELYPAERRLVDTSNEFHLWVLPPDMLVPCGFGGRLVSEHQSGKSRQRPFEEKPADLTPPEAMERLLRSV